MTVTLVQGPATASVYQSSSVVTLTNTPTSGNVLIAVIGEYDGNNQGVSSITQTGVTWSKVVNNSLYSIYAEIWIGIVGSGASNTLTIAWDNGNFMTAYVCEYSGVGNVDVTAVNQNMSATPDTGATSQTSQASELWIGAINLQFSTQSNPTNGFTLIADNNLGSDYCNGLAYLQKIVSAQGTADCSTTGSGSGVWAGCIATFKAASTTTYNITASADSNSSISPSGTVVVNSGGNQAFAISANAGYHITHVYVDSVDQGAISSYTFSDVTANHTISVTSAINTYTITASADANSTISPAGTTYVNYGANQSYTMSANSGYQISSVYVDGVGQGAITSYTFSDVQANHTISVSSSSSGGSGGSQFISSIASGAPFAVSSGALSLNVSSPLQVSSSSLGVNTGASATFAGLIVNGSAGINTLNVTSGLTLNESAGNSGQVLTSGGSGNAPTWQTVSSGSGSYVGTNGIIISGSTISLDSSYSPTFAGLTANGAIYNKGFYNMLDTNGTTWINSLLLANSASNTDFHFIPNYSTQSGGASRVFFGYNSNWGSYNWMNGLTTLLSLNSSGALTTKSNNVLDDGSGNMTLGAPGSTLTFYTPASTQYPNGLQLNLQAKYGMSSSYPYPVLYAPGAGFEADDIQADGVLATTSTNLSGGIGGGAVLIGHGFYGTAEFPPCIVLTDSGYGTLSLFTSVSPPTYGNMALENLNAYGSINISGSTQGTLVSGYGYLNSNGASGYLTNSGQVNVSLTTSYRIFCGGEIDCYSDQRDKNLIDALSSPIALDAVMKLNPLHFIWKPETKKGNNVVAGFFAQEVAKAIPEAVIVHEGERYSDEHNLNYNVLVTYALSAIQGLAKEVEDLRSQIK